MLVNHVFNPCCARTLVSSPTAGCMAVSVGLNRELALLATFPRSFSCSPHSLCPAGHLPKVILSLSLPCWSPSQGHSLALHTLSALLVTFPRSFYHSLCPAGHLLKVILSLSLPCWPPSQGHSLALSALSTLSCFLHGALVKELCQCVCVCVCVMDGHVSPG